MNRIMLLIVLTVAISASARADDAHFVFPAWAKHVPSGAYNGLTVADFNADGIPDVAVVSADTGGECIVTVLLAQSDGSLGDPRDFSTGDWVWWALDMAAGDLVPDPDNLPDLVVVGTDYQGGDSEARILRNLGAPDYGFAFEQVYTVPGGSRAELVTVCDFDGNGLPDIAHAGHTGSVYVRYQQPTGGFTEPLEIPSNFDSGLASSDLDADGYCDLVFRDNSGVTVLYGTPDQVFERQENYPQHPAVHQQEQLVIADFSGDGRPDIAHGGHYTTDVYVYYANEEGGFDAPESFYGARSTALLAAGDVDGDGRTDLVTHSTYLDGAGPASGAVLYSQGNTGFSEPVPFITVVIPLSLGVADLDRDGRDEVLVAGAGNVGASGGLIAIVRSRTRGLIATGQPFEMIGANPMALAAGDFDQDGATDLAVLNHDDEDVSVLWNLGDGSLERRGEDLAVGPFPLDIVVGHFDDDDLLDLAIANGGPDSVTLWHGAGLPDEPFTGRENLNIPGGATACTAGHFDEDTRMDLACVAGGRVVVLRGVPGSSLEWNPELDD